MIDLGRQILSSLFLFFVAAQMLYCCYLFCNGWPPLVDDDIALTVATTCSDLDDISITTCTDLDDLTTIITGELNDKDVEKCSDECSDTIEC